MFADSRGPVTEADVEAFAQYLRNFTSGQLLRLSEHFRPEFVYIAENDIPTVLQELISWGVIQSQQAQAYADLEKRQDSAKAAETLVNDVLAEGYDTALGLWKCFFALRSRWSHPNLQGMVEEIIHDGYSLLEEILLDGSGCNLDPEVKACQDEHKNLLREQTKVLKESGSLAQSEGQNFPILGRYVAINMVSDVHFRKQSAEEHEALAAAGELNEYRLRHKTQAELERITPDRLFRWCFRARRSPQSVMVSGVAGVGKTTLVQKFVFDWATGRHYQKFAFVFFFKFRDLNALGPMTSLERLIQQEYPRLGGKLPMILQEPKKLLFIFDGLDESNCDLDLSRNRSQDLCAQVGDVKPVGVIVASLLKQTLLKGCSILLTSRPNKLVYLETGVLHRVASIVGFLSRERERYFLNFFGDYVVANKALAYVRDSQVLYTLCYNPSYCWITCTALQPCFASKMGQPQPLPKTVTQLFVSYIKHMLANHSRQLPGPSEVQDMLIKLGWLADYGLSNHTFVFDQNYLEAFNVNKSPFLTAFLVENIQASVSVPAVTYSFIHLTVQEFFAALVHYLDFKEDNFNDVMVAAQNNHGGEYEIFSRFLCGLSHPATRVPLEENLGKFSTVTTKRVIEWLAKMDWRVLISMDTGARKKDTGMKRKAMNVFHLLFEAHNTQLVRQAVEETSHVDFSELFLMPVDCIILAYILSCCRQIACLNLDSCLIQVEGLQRLGPQLHKIRELSLHNNDLKDAAMKDIVCALKHSDCKLESLSLENNVFTEPCCEDLGSALSENQTLWKLDLAKNKLQDQGLSRLLKAFSDPRCKIRELVFEKTSRNRKVVNPALTDSREETSRRPLAIMAQTPRAASTLPDSSLSSVFLVKLSALVKSVGLPPKPSIAKQLPELTPVSQVAEEPADVSEPFRCPEDPPRELTPWIALEECRNELDERFEEAEREIKALMDFWENCFVDDEEDRGPEIPWISKRPLEDSLDLKDECLWEDPSYNEGRMEQEALQDYLKELEEQRPRAPFEQAASQQRDAVTSGSVGGKSPALSGRCTTSAKALASRSQEEARGESVSPSSSSKEEEASIPLKMMPKMINPIQNWASGTGKMHTSNSPDRSEELQRHEQKVFGHYHRNHQQPVTGQSRDKSETSFSSRGGEQPSKPYNLRCQSKVVSYVSQLEEGLSGGTSEEDWVPGEEESDAEEEDVEEGEDSQAEREKALEADTGPAQAKPQRRNGSQTVRSYPCPECGREFSNSSNMKKHWRIHKGELPYGCHVCGKSYSDPSNLAKHQQKHRGERNHACPICPKAYYLKSQLHAHIRHHQGIRPFACMECSRSFCSRIELLMHMKTHLEGKRSQTPVDCTDCNLTFPSMKHLQQHQKRHKVCEDCGQVFGSTGKYMFHRAFHVSTCLQCGATYTGAHPCQGAAQKAKRPKRATPKSSASASQGVVANQPVDTAVRARSQKQPIGSTQAVTRSSGTGTPKHPLPILKIRRTESWELAQTPLQPKPAGVPPKNVPIVCSVTSNPAIAKPFAQPPALPPLTGLATLQPHSQAGIALPISAAVPPVTVPLTDSCPGPLTVTIPLGPTQLLGSNPVSGAADKNLIQLDLAMFPPGTKIILEIPNQKTGTAQICAVCKTSYLGIHRCRKLPKDPAAEVVEVIEEEEPRMCQPRAEESSTVQRQASPVHPPCPQVQEERKPLATAHSLYQANPRVTYALGDEEVAGSDMKEGCEVKWSEVGKLPSPANAEHRQKRRQTKRRKKSYMCNVCDKRFTQHFAFRWHMRLHKAFSCDQCDASFLQSEQLKCHKLCHI